jgi:hypothetical protein
VRYDPQCVRARPRLPSAHGNPPRSWPFARQQRTALCAYLRRRSRLLSRTRIWAEKCRVPGRDAKDRMRRGLPRSTRPTPPRRWTSAGTA